LVNIQLVKILIDVLSRWINLSANPQVIDAHRKTASVSIVSHGQLCMGVLSICVFNQDVDDALLPSSAPLNNSDAFANIEALPHVVGANSDLEGLRSFGQQFYESVRDVLNEASTVFELSVGDFDSIAALYLELGIIFDRQLESFVFEQVPLILVIVVDLVEQLLGLGINLEKANLLQAGTNILR